MNFWDILGVPPASDLSAVKKAYAKKLKIHHPEDDPEGYQRLREAYDAAVKAAKAAARYQSRVPEEEAAAGGEASVLHEGTEVSGRIEPPAAAETDDNEENVLDSEDWEDEEWYRQPLRLRFPEIVPAEQENGSSPADKLFSGLESLYSDFSMRIEPANWEKLLDSTLLWDLRLMEWVRQRMIYFLREHPHLPRLVWELLERTFQWKEWEEELRERHAGEVLDELFLRFSSSWELPYGFIVQEDVANRDVDGFLELRSQALRALQENELEDAETCLLQALRLYGEDAATLGLYEELLERQGKYPEALKVCGEILELDPDNAGMLFRRAKLSHPAEPEAAAAACLAVLALKPEHEPALALLAGYYDQLGDYAAAKERYLQLLQLAPDHVHARLYLFRREGLAAESREAGTVKLYKLKWSLAGALRLAWRPILAKALPYLLLVLVVQLFVILSSAPVGITDIVAGQRSSTSGAETEVNIGSADDWRQSWKEGAYVQLEIPARGYLGNVVLYQFATPAKTMYVTQAEGERLGLFKNYTFNYVLIGMLHGKAVPMVVEHYADAKDLFDNKPLRLKGRVEPVPAGMLSAIQGRMQSRQVKLPEGMLDRSLFLDNTQSQPSPANTLPISAGIVAFQLVLLVLFCMEMGRIGRSFSMTKWHVPGKEPVWQSSGWNRM